MPFKKFTTYRNKISLKRNQTDATQYKSNEEQKGHKAENTKKSAMNKKTYAMGTFKVVS